MDDAKESNLEINEDLKIVSKASEPLFKSLAYTFTPPLPGISGDLEGATTFLEKIGLSYGIKFTDLADEEKDVLTAELIKINPDIFGDCYLIPQEIPMLRDIEEYAYILEWVKREGAVQLNSSQYLYSEDKVLKSVMGTIASIGLSVELIDSSKPVLGLSRLHNDIKISGRTTRDMVDKGVDLGKALRDSSNNFGGTGGGHDIAAGAMIPYESKDKFLHLFDEMIEYQLNND